MRVMHNYGMKLEQYLAKRKETDAAFGKRAGLSQSQISRLRRGKSNPSLDAIKRIAEATGGKVKFDDWTREPVEPAQ